MTLSKKWKTLWRKLNDADTEWATSGRSRRYYWRREALRQIMICFHDWTKWKITGGQGFQRRHCKKCGKIQQVAL